MLLLSTPKTRVYYHINYFLIATPGSCGGADTAAIVFMPALVLVSSSFCSILLLVMLQCEWFCSIFCRTAYFVSQ